MFPHSLPFLFLTLAAIAFAAPLEGEPKKWALLIAGSNGFYNYRHQADVSHAYQILKGRGIPVENIVTMMYDDVANDPQNPRPGELFNGPELKDFYKGVKIDYRGDDVNRDVFLNVMKGNKAGVQGVGNGRVIDSGPDDHVFIYYTDHGAAGLIAMPTGDVLTKDDLWKALEYMYENKRYSKLVFYMEACESGSMFDGYPTDRNLYAVTASNGDESSWAVYCSVQNFPCLGDEFSVNWMHDTEVNEAHTESLKTQYEDTNKATKQSHVCKFGDFDFSSESIGDFQGDRCDKSEKEDRFEKPKTGWAVQDVYLRELEKKTRLADTVLEREIVQKDLQLAKQNRARVAHLFWSIAQRLLGSSPLLGDVVAVRPKSISEMECHSRIAHFFDRSCLSFSQNPYALHHAFVLANLCDQIKSPQKIIAAMASECVDLEFNNVH
ncbi:hypothetical protein L596_011275 [Steinernema carpocapsae]|uniref:legumain n=1 Tax=Steinernema carpocapsae TaxID=34508 RepID=A0A4U5NU70_STECR|nr:hypothetical protein L596_011275 [Steinernema carpocapsae]